MNHRLKQKLILLLCGASVLGFTFQLLGQNAPGKQTRLKGKHRVNVRLQTRNPERRMDRPAAGNQTRTTPIPRPKGMRIRVQPTMR
jgi:hypothetical protein